jgi:hypothetical protein
MKAVPSYMAAVSGKRFACGLLAVAIVSSAIDTASALSLAAPCRWFVDKERFAEENESGWDFYILEAWPEKQANGFVSFYFEKSTGINSVNHIGLQNCENQKSLLIFVTPKTEKVVHEAFRSSMVDGKPRTMSMIASEMEKLGAEIKWRSTSIGTCACEFAETE